MDHVDGLFKVLEQIGSNAYKLEQPGDMNVCASFNVDDLAFYIEDDIEDLSENPLQDVKP